MSKLYDVLELSILCSKLKVNYFASLQHSFMLSSRAIKVRRWPRGCWKMVRIQSYQLVAVFNNHSPLVQISQFWFNPSPPYKYIAATRLFVHFWFNFAPMQHRLLLWHVSKQHNVRSQSHWLLKSRQATQKGSSTEHHGQDMVSWAHIALTHLGTHTVLRVLPRNWVAHLIKCYLAHSLNWCGST